VPVVVQDFIIESLAAAKFVTNFLNGFRGGFLALQNMAWLFTANLLKFVACQGPEPRVDVFNQTVCVSNDNLVVRLVGHQRKHPKLLALRHFGGHVLHKGGVHDVLTYTQF